jgi:hypothetical protein
MTATTATATGRTALVTEASILVTATYVNGQKATLATETRPACLADADTFLAVHSLRRSGEWDLVGSAVGASVESMDNRFNGTVAARLWEAVGTTHDDFKVMSASDALDGDLISDMEISEVYVVAGTRFEMDTMRIHMVAEGKAWEDRYTTDFNAGTLVQVARKR